jgi:hypothetical protein
MNLTPETAREHLLSLIMTSADVAVRPSDDDVNTIVDRIVAAELRALLARHPGGSLNYWASRRADELDARR